MKAREALIRVNLADRMDFIPDQLSGGQQQRVASVVPSYEQANRHLLWQDEPTGNLDVERAGEEIIDLFKELAKDEYINIDGNS